MRRPSPAPVKPHPVIPAWAPATCPRHRQVQRLLPALAWMGVIFVLSAQPALPAAPGLGATLTTIGGHLVVFTVLALLLAWGLREIVAPRVLTPLAFALAVAYGLSDELHQAFIPGRDAAALDLALDTIGAATALLAMGLPPRRWTAPPRFPGRDRS